MGAEAWAMRKKEEKQLERTEMRMLRWLMSYLRGSREVSRWDGVCNESVYERWGIWYML